MLKYSIAFAAGAVALLISAPGAFADDPPLCSDPTQCAQQPDQNPSGGAANGVQRGVDIAQKVYSHGDTSSPGWQNLLDGIPYCMHPGAQIRAGVVITNPDPRGFAIPC
ncbi:hypothetical protein [Mycolicibacter longobardus]|uniref:Uncharacterized protein n=1 Tax=Mycolicibacter longobardus TaxID=1108812 RepID=A0A1X1Y7W3_9MYCO|nr:hypothetical protein [Mycolicibacter longobardus]MCV7383195.1 hypothetical protein [Mycolicibacter longobardus]ORW07156.1 hypothetical protein AWC16_21960 [Mycolicibacter longobardus]